MTRRTGPGRAGPVLGQGERSAVAPWPQSHRLPVDVGPVQPSRCPGPPRRPRRPARSARGGRSARRAARPERPAGRGRRSAGWCGVTRPGHVARWRTALLASDLTPAVKLVLLVATEQITGYGDVPMSYADLGRRLSMAPRTVRGHSPEHAPKGGSASSQPSARRAAGPRTTARRRPSTVATHRPPLERQRWPGNPHRRRRESGHRRMWTVATHRPP